MRVQFFGTLALTALLFVSMPPSTRIRAADAAVDAKSGEIVIRVIDGAGSPKADATVSLWIYDRDLQSYKETSRDVKTDRFGIAPWATCNRRCLHRTRDDA